MKTLNEFKTTKQFFNYIAKNLKTQYQVKKTGELFEHFVKVWHLEYSGYINIYDTNDFDSIPAWVLDKTNSWNLLARKGDSRSIDKFAVDRNGNIDVHQDKSNLHQDKNLSVDKAEAMMSMRLNPLENISNFIINTTAQDLSHYSKDWENQPPITYGYNRFVPASDDVEACKKDKQFWKNIKLKAKGKSTSPIYALFEPRGPAQTDYLEAGLSYAKSMMAACDQATWHQIGVGSLGKSVLDAVMLAQLRYLWTPELTNSPQPVTVSSYHSSKTLPKNGWEEVQRYRAAGIYDKVYVISDSKVVDMNDGLPFTKMMNSIDGICKIKKDMEEGSSVLLLNLYHHGEIIARIKEGLDELYPGFKFWARKRDECDWPCSNVHSRYSPLLDHRTESVLTFGSSGTERFGKDPIMDYGMNNTQIHGPLVHRFGWGEAEDGDYVKKLIFIMPQVKESEVANLFPDSVDKDGRVDWNLRVKGVQVKGEFPTIGLLADMVCLIKTLVEYPEIKRILGFAHFIKTNQLVEANWEFICDAILESNSDLSKRVLNLHHLVLNDDSPNSLKIKDHSFAIKKAKSHLLYLIGSCSVLGRGYDDTNSPKHHACIHWDIKDIVQTCQEIWRVTRNDPDNVNGNPYVYYILPLRMCDLGEDTPTISEERLRILMSILKQNKNIAVEFESLMQNPNGSRKKRPHGDPRIWIPGDFDAKAFANIVTMWSSTDKKGQVFGNTMVDGHNFVTAQFLATPYSKINSAMARNQIKMSFFSDTRFKSIFEVYAGPTGHDDGNEMFRQFYKGEYFSRRASNFSSTQMQIVVNNCIALDDHQNKCIAKKDKMINDIRSAMLDFEKTLIAPKAKSRTFMGDKLAKKYNILIGDVYRYAGKANISETIYKNNQRKVYDALFDVAEKSAGLDEWAENTAEQIKENVSSVTANIVKVYFVRADYYNVLSEAEMKHFREVETEVKRKKYSAVALSNAANRTPEQYATVSIKRGQTMRDKGMVNENGKLNFNNYPHLKKEEQDA